MSITVRKYNKSDLKQWDEFVENSNNGTLFHLRKFLDYHPDGRFIDNSLIFAKKEKIISIFPGALKEKDGQMSLISHPGASMGSCVVPENFAFSDALELTEQLVSYATKNGIDRLQITLPPIIYYKRFSQYLDFAYQKSGFNYQKREVTSILFLENTIEKCLDKFKSNHRTAVRKAEKSGIQIRQSEDFTSFFSILKKNLSIRHNVKPAHTLEEMLRLKKIFPEKIVLFGAFFEKEMIAGVVNFVMNSKTVLAFYISHVEKYQELRPINLLFYQIFKWAIQNQLQIFDFGIFTVNENPNMGLARFKENFGASGVFRDTIELNLI
jgi:hypothetical protein